MMNLSINGPFQIPQNNLSNNNKISGTYESYKTNLISKDLLKQKRSGSVSSDEEIIIYLFSKIILNKELHSKIGQNMNRVLYKI